MISLNIPDYDKAGMHLIQEVMEGFMNNDQLLSGIEFGFTNHIGPIRNVRTEQQLDQKMSIVQAESSISQDSIKNSYIEDYIVFLFRLSETQRDGLKKMFFHNMAEITSATGNVVHANGKPLSYDLILDLIEKVEFGFDDDGNPQYPSLVLPPKAIEELKKIKPTAAQEKRLQRIIKNKRAEFYAKKRTRRLS